MDFSWLPEVGAAGSAVAVCYMFLRAQSKDREHRTTERDAFLEIVTNHIAHCDDTMRNLTAAIEKLGAKMKD